MERDALPAEAERAVETIKQADIVIGIPSFNNARTIGHVVRACYAGLSKYFPQLSGVVINSDGGSTDGTREAVLSASVDDVPHAAVDATVSGTPSVVSLSRNSRKGQRLPDGVRNGPAARGPRVRGRRFRFAVDHSGVDRSAVRPILFANYDFVAPYYHRHKYDGTITNSIVYPLTRMLYGSQVRQPIGGDFGVSPPSSTATCRRMSGKPTSRGSASTSG